MTRREKKQRAAEALGSTYIPVLDEVVEVLAWCLVWLAYYPARWRHGRNQSVDTPLDGGAR